MKLVVLGGGESGVGAALLGRHLGYEVFLSDKGKLAVLPGAMGKRRLPC